MSSESDVLVALAPLGLALLKAGVDAINGRDSKAVARDTIAALLAEVPVDELRLFLTEGGIARGELLADIAEAAKFSTDPLDED